LLAKNDSVIINTTTFRSDQINEMLNRANKYDYNAVFIGDSSIKNAILDFNIKKNKKYRFINAKLRANAKKSAMPVAL
jgi:hypothetical protein